MEDIVPIVLAVLAFLGAGGVVLVKLLLKKPPARSAPLVSRETDKVEEAERAAIDERVEKATAEVEEIDEAPDRERTRRAGARLRK